MSKRIFWVIILFCALMPFGIKAQNPHWANASPTQYSGSPACMYEDTTTNLLYIGSGYYVHVFNGFTYPIMGTSFGSQGVRSIIKYNGTFYVGSTSIGKGFSMWNGTAWDTTGVAANGCAWSMYVYNGDLYVGGNFTHIAGINANGLAKFDGTNWSAVGNLPFTNFTGIISITSYNGELYVGGQFMSTIGNNIARWNGSQWNSVGGGFYGGMDAVECLEVFNNKLYMGGMFTVGSGNVGDYIAQWDGTTLSGVGGGVQGIGNGQIHDLQTYHNALYAGGVFSFAGGVPAEYIAKWDGTNWCGTFDTLNNIVTALGIYRDTFYIGGAFSRINTTDTIVGLAKWIGGNFGDTCGNTTGIEEELQKNSAMVFPNPASDIIVFQTENPIGEISITDQLGREVRRQKINGEKRIEISVADLADGMYFYQVVEKDNIKSSGKFIVQH